MELKSSDIKVTGEWDGEMIWREKTPEEKTIDRLSRMGMKRIDAQRFVYAIKKL